jgi:hypothetical protein
MLMPYQIERTQTSALKQCHACEAMLLSRDKFCRKCGIRQASGYTTLIDRPSWSWGDTGLLTDGTDGYRAYSEQLIGITESLWARTALDRLGREWRRLARTLITIPLCMLIVILSPLDRYTATTRPQNGGQGGKAMNGKGSRRKRG